MTLKPEQQTPVQPTPAGAGEDPDLAFPDALARAARDSGLRKAQRTRFGILAAAARLLLGGVAPHALRVTDIARGAGIAHGTFYLHFHDRDAAVAAVLEVFANFVYDQLAAVHAGAPGSPERVRAATRVYVHLFRVNVGLMACLMRTDPGNGGSSERLFALNRAWNSRVATAIRKGRAALGETARSDDDMLAVAYALDAMVDEFLIQIYIRGDPVLRHLRDDTPAVIELLTDLWLRGAYGQLPATTRVK